MKISIILILIIFITACTAMLWQKEPYIEHVGGFYIEEKSNTLVAIGKKYHYIFQVDKELIEILKVSKSFSYKPAFKYFNVTKNNKISGELKLAVEVVSTLTSKDMSLLQKLGFVYASYNSSFNYKIVINGERYVVKTSFDNVVNFDQAYQVEITEPFSDKEESTKNSLTPVTSTVDGVLIIPLGVLYGVFFFVDNL